MMQAMVFVFGNTSSILYSYLFSVLVASLVAIGSSALSSYDWKSSLAEQKLASEDSEQPSLLFSDKLK